MATETHIPGLVLTISDSEMIQRCAWCGAVLLAYDFKNMMVAGDKWEPPGHYEVGGLVRFHYDGPVARMGEVTLTRTISETLELGEDAKLPDDACARHIPLEGAE